METLAQYGSSSDSDNEPPVSYGAIASFKNKFRALNATPAVVERDEVMFGRMKVDIHVINYLRSVQGNLLLSHSTLLGPILLYIWHLSKNHKSLFSPKNGQT